MPSSREHRYALVLVLAFLVLIGGVPVSQAIRELWRGERVQFTDVFRNAPTAAGLREFEATLKEKSWVQQALRPLTQRLLFGALGDTGAKAIAGREGWLFYRPDVRYLLEPDRPEVDPPDARWATPGPRPTRRASVVRAIVRFRDQLAERGIALVVVPVPGKPSVYPEQLTARVRGREEAVVSPTQALLLTLERQGVAVVDLFRVFAEARHRSPQTVLYLARDTHWTPLGAGLAAEAVARKLRDMGCIPAPTTRFRSLRVPVQRQGDIVEMMQWPGLERAFASESVECEQVLDPVLGPLVPRPSDRPGVYRYPGQRASVLVLGDSFSRIYQYPEPRSLGTVTESEAQSIASPNPDANRPATKRLLPGSAGFVALLARALQSPVDAIVSDGGASTDVRRRLSTNPEILEGKTVVVWECVERDLALGRGGWEDVPLPTDLGGASLPGRDL